MPLIVTGPGLPTLRHHIRASFEREDRAAVEALEQTMARVDPAREWVSEEYAARMDLHRVMRRRIDRIHRDQSYHAPIIAEARQELAARALVRALAGWVSELLT